jgi:hypothetical protein
MCDCNWARNIPNVWYYMYMYAYTTTGRIYIQQEGFTTTGKDLCLSTVKLSGLYDDL